MKKIILTCFLVFAVLFNAISQKIYYPVFTIPDSLKENADAVVRYSNTELIITSMEDAVLKVKEVITILKKSGERHAYISIGYDKSNKINYIEGRIYDNFGKYLRKYKKEDIKDKSYYDGYSLFSDNRRKYIGKPALNPPYTIEYEYEKKITGLYGVPGWSPVPGEGVAVENANYTIQYPSSFRLHTNEINCEKVIKKDDFINKNKSISYKLKNYKTIEGEPFNNNYYEYFPIVKARLSDFVLDGYKGNSDSWGNIGEWKNQLLVGRDYVPDETRNEIIKLISKTDSEKIKAKLIYEYMQSKTRYVSIQEGIGGLQPFSAETVDETGYGDCKALSNYTMALLKVAGIQSYYTSVYAGPDFPDLFRKFPSHQSNHAILCVPFENDTVWLECTSQTKPFGFIGEFTDDRDVLIINSEGKGEIAHTTIYPEEINTQIRTANLILDEEGNVSADITTIYSGLQYENVNELLVLSEDEQKKEIIKQISIPNLKLESFSFKENKDMIPSIEEVLEMNINRYASVSSGRIFITANLLNRNEYIPKTIENRKTEIVFRRGYIDIDSINYTIPENYISEFIPEHINEVTKFGNYSVKIELHNNKLVFIRKLTFHKGNYPPEDYEELRNFYKLIYKNDKQTVVLLKKE